MNDSRSDTSLLESDGWTSAATPPEGVGERYEVRLSGGEIREALWTGSRWWSHSEVQPEAWRQVSQPPSDARYVLF